MQEIILNWLGSGFCGSLLGILFGSYLSQRQQNHFNKQKAQQAIFTTYSERYARIMSLIVKTYSKIGEEDFNKENAEQREQLAEFFLLFSEQYTLYKKGLLEKEVWEMWEQNLNRQMKSGFFCQAWCYIESQIEFSQDYTDYLDRKVQKEAQNKTSVVNFVFSFKNL